MCGQSLRMVHYGMEMWKAPRSKNGRSWSTLCSSHIPATPWVSLRWGSCRRALGKDKQHQHPLLSCHQRRFPCAVSGRAAKGGCREGLYSREGGADVGDQQRQHCMKGDKKEGTKGENWEKGVRTLCVWLALFLDYSFWINSLDLLRYVQNKVDAT